jgi:hypothetical protein
MWRLSVFLLTILFACPIQAEKRLTWGFFAHKHINRLAVFTLPAEMMVFYKPRIYELTESSVDPDRRRHIVKGEAPRHYIDLDRYSCPDSLPRLWRDAVAQYTEDSLTAHGIVPWHIDRQRYALINAFRILDGVGILRLSADLGHYIGDAHVPLHTTSNYDGQQTGQEGIHGFWESRLPELFLGEYELFTGHAIYLENPRDAIWLAILESHSMVDSVLSLEKELHMEEGDQQIKGFEYRGNKLQQVFSRRYAALYHNRLNHMVERQMKKSIALTANIWYSCWVDAGMPDLNKVTFRSGFTEKWRQRYDSLYRYDSVTFMRDSHLNESGG